MRSVRAVLAVAVVAATVAWVPGPVAAQDPEPDGPTGPWVFISAGYHYGCAITASADAHCWGRNNAGQLGDDTQQGTELDPVLVAGGHQWRSVSTGVAHTCGVTVEDVGHCWGSNGNGQLGDGSIVTARTPRPVAGGHRWASISVGASYTCGVTTSGAGYCWGFNVDGQLGDGTGLPSSTPGLVDGGHQWRSITAGTLMTCGVATSGAGYCWGNNGSPFFGFHGALGVGSEELRELSPRLVVGGHQWRSISAGDQHACGVTTTGAGLCWGANSQGQVNGTFDTVVSPTVVPGPWDVLEAGSQNSCGITTTGTSGCWGVNSQGQLGIGTAGGSVATMQPVVGGHQWATIVPGLGGNTCGLTVAGSGFCWGPRFEPVTGFAFSTVPLPVLLPAAADLVVTLVSPPPGVRSKGETFVVAVRTENVGEAAAEASRTVFWLGREAVRGEDDVALEGARVVPALEPEAEDVSGATVELRVPPDTPAGTYHLLACADGDGAVAESDEANNCLAADSTLAVLPTADLEVRTVGNPPTVRVGGATFTSTVAVANDGDAQAQAATLDLVLVPQSGGAPVAVAEAPVGVLSAGQVASVAVTARIPVDTPIGTYQLRACVIPTGTDADPTNDCATASRLLAVVLAPDLLVTEVSDPPPVVAAGEKFVVTDTTRNGGASNVGTSRTGYWLAADQDLPVDALLLLPERSVPALIPGQSHTGSVEVTVPGVVASGTYWLFACADNRVARVEGDETNNCRAADATVEVVGAGPDLRVTALDELAQRLPAGEAVTVDATVANLGTAPAGETVTGFGLTPVAGGGPVLDLGEVSTPSLGPGATHRIQDALATPADAPPGPYHLRACADTGDDVDESDETNNCTTSATTLTIDPPTTTTAPPTTVPPATAPPTSVPPATAPTAPPSTGPPAPAPAGDGPHQLLASAAMVAGATVDLTVVSPEIVAGRTYRGTLESTPVPLGPATATIAGRVTFPGVTLPPDWTLGTPHTLTVIDQATGIAVLVATFTVDPTGTPGPLTDPVTRPIPAALRAATLPARPATGRLPATGTDPAPLATTGATLTALGATLLTLLAIHRLRPTPPSRPPTH